MYLLIKTAIIASIITYMTLPESESQSEQRRRIQLTNDLWFDLGSGEIRQDWEILHRFSDRQASVFQMLVENPNMVVTYEMLLSQIWNYPIHLNDLYKTDIHMVQTNIRRIRNGLKNLDKMLQEKDIESDLNQRLVNIPGRGYRWNDFSREFEELNPIFG